MKERYLVTGFQPATRRISLDGEWAESAVGALAAVAGMRKNADVLLAWTPTQMRQMADLLSALTPEQIAFNRRSAELEERAFLAGQTIRPTVGTVGMVEPRSSPFLVISYNPVTEAVHLDTEWSDCPDTALVSVAGIRCRSHVILALTPAQLREMAANLEWLTAEQMAVNRRAAEQEEKAFTPKSQRGASAAAQELVSLPTSPVAEWRDGPDPNRVPGGESPARMCPATRTGPRPRGCGL
jgi:hypothetical protein